MSNSTKKFSELDRIENLDNSDILAVTDVDQVKSMHIRVGDLSSNVVLSDTNIASKAETIRNKLNDFNTGVGNGLKAQELWHSGAYRNSTYFLNYNNLANRPTIPTNLTELSNSNEFIRYNSSIQEMRVDGTDATERQMVTDYLPEGNDNLYYTNERVVTQIEANFGALFNNYSDTFDGGGIGDSLVDVAGAFQSTVSSQSSIIRVQDSDQSLRTSFKRGQVLRLYGASPSDSNIVSPPALSNFSVTPQGAFSTSGSSNAKIISYKIAFYNLKTGEVSEASAAKQITMYYDAGQGAGNEVIYDSSSSKFNTDNFITIDLNGYQEGNSPQGVLIYRKLPEDSQWKLVAVTGSKELPSWKDYHTFDYNSWSGKNSVDNSFSTITHFPLTAPTESSGLRGWTDVTIDSISPTSTYFDIVISPSVWVNPDNVVSLAHNDTSTINSAITSKANSGRRSLSLNAKTYNASHIIVPNDFGLIGTANITKIRKLPWTGYNGGSADNSLIKTLQSTNAQNLSFVGIDFDGNLQNQYLLNDTTDFTLNYLVNLGSNPQSTIIDRSKFLNSIGGGIYSTSPNEFKMTASEIVNSGVTDRFEFSPLIVDSGSTTILTGNRFENFTDSIDASVTSEGAIANNIIKACGSGLFVYGSTFLVSSPNVLMGAANEFLSSPDILNSEFDSINIYLAQLENVPPYTSDVFTYQENGAAFDLAQSSVTGQSGNVVYRANLVQQLSDGSTQVYGDRVGPGATGINGAAFNNFVVGKRYRIIETGNANWTAHGALSDLPGTEFVWTGSTTASGSSGFATPSEFVGYASNGPITFTDVPASEPHINRDRGEFQFQLQGADFDRMRSGIYAPANLQSLYNAEVTAGRQPAGSKHLGIAYSASYRYFAQVGVISGSATLSTTYNHPTNSNYDASTTNPVYTVNITQIERKPLAVGNYVRLSSSHGLSLHNDTGATKLGQIVAIGPEGDIITIKYWGAGDGSTAGTGGCTAGADSTGTINIIDDFVMAQGLIK